MSFLLKLFAPFKAIGRAFASVFREIDEEKVVNVLKRTAALAKVAYPFVRMLAAATPTQADDLLLEAAAKVGVSLENILTKAKNPIEDIMNDGARQRVVAEAFKKFLFDTIAKDGKIEAEGVTFLAADVLNLDKTSLLTITQLAVELYKKAQK